MEEFGIDSQEEFEKVLSLLGGVPQEMSVPTVVVTPMYLALEFLTENETNYALFMDYLKVRIPDTVELTGVPDIESTRNIVNALRDADPTLKYLS